MEYNSPTGVVVSKLELAFRRDDNVLRYLTIAVDKNRSQYNSDKRAGKFILTEEERKAKKNRRKRRDDDDEDDAVLDLDL
jgi:small subunit ribosomal protein S6